MINTQDKYWFGKAPGHWSTVRVKSLFRLACESSKENHGMELLSVYTDIGVRPRKELEQKGNKASTTDGYWLVREGDLVVNKLLAWMGAIGYSEYNGVTSPAYDILRARTTFINPKFYHYLFRLKLTQGEFRRWSKGIMDMRLRLYFSELGNVFIPCPPLSEQNAIVEFIDNENDRIDKLLEKKKKLISIIKLREESFIKDCLTGRDLKYIDLKETTVPWLGKIPAHWRTMRLRHLVRIATGGKDTKDRVDNGDYPFYVRSMKIERINSFSMNEESVLTSGDGAGVGEVFHHVFGKFDLHQRMYAFTNFREVSGDYFYYFLMAFFKMQMSQWSAKSTVDSVRMPFLKTMVFTVPPKEEQERIVDKIKKQSGKYHDLIWKTEESIRLLKEFRNSLITEVVTGRLDIKLWKKRGSTDKRLDNIEGVMRT
ncbi:restriction endonuclease subunit S [uncultured Legionella sp.]|uniref:restriction endonuclease subunit S n=1 Tax=uncultured Legionella sp. TaxID=210934 RepID=UPI001A21C8C2|nr:restriction endonuclease subunit S [uncultured Legionella sp.]HAU1788574.1 hypothetical protein [Legionella pneumophila]